MFSQLRNAVEQLAQQPIRVLDVASPETHSEHVPRSQSLDMQAAPSASPLSSSQLAESALSSLRKSLSSQRSGGSTQAIRTPSSPSPAENTRLHKSNLEERLRRATFAIGEPSGSSVPNRSNRVASPSPMSRNREPRHERSASTTPLPASPSPTSASERDSQQAQPADLSLQEKSPSESPLSPTPKEESAAAIIEPIAVVQPALPAESYSINEKAMVSLEQPPVDEPLRTLTELPKEEESLPIVHQPETEGEVRDLIPENGATAASPESETEAALAILSPSQAVPQDAAPSQSEVVSELPHFSPAQVGDPSDKDVADSPGPLSSSSIVDQSAEVESLQARLKQVEQRFSDVSTSFKRLQAEKLAADSILREVTPLESINDANALREFFSNLKSKDQVFQDEFKRLNQKLELQEDRLEDLRDTHKLESHSRSEEVKKLRTQLDETEALFQAAQRATTHAEETSNKQKEEITRLQKELEQSKNVAKEEEEKRVKAISLLKTVRQKLVKLEKDKEDAMKEIAAGKEREKGDKNKEQAERLNFQHEMESLNATHEKAAATLKAQFEKDLSNMRERYEQEISALRGQFESDVASTKTIFTKELSAKTSQISTLESTLNGVTRDKNAFFDQLQLRQAELESAHAHLESLEHQNTEFQFQLRESSDRLAMLKEEYAELLRESETRSREPVTSADEIARIISATEAKYEAKVAEVKRDLSILEKERYESEADWSRKLKEKVKDLEDLKRVLGTATRSRENEENVLTGLKAELTKAQEAAQALQHQVTELPVLREQILELKKSSREQEQEMGVKILVLEKQLDEHRSHEVQLKQSNKTLREELRKVQSSAALLERQRNPGVGYWTTRTSESNGHASADPRVSVSSSTESPSRVSSPTPSTAASNNNEEEVNLEYLRNVILQFLEHKEMRPNLVKVLSIILHFTPQETRRLIAKV